MYSDFSQVYGYNSNLNTIVNKNETNNKISEKLLNSKIYYLNISLSKYVCVGMNINFAPSVVIGGQNGFKVIFT